MVVWTQSGYLDAGTWDHFRSKIDQAALTAPPSGSRLQQLDGMVNIKYSVSTKGWKFSYVPAVNLQAH